jgi:V/A-type H+-transporting ATPase subunit E
MSIKDGLSAVADEVLGDAQKEAEAIILAAENEAKQTLKAAKEQADQNYLSLMKQATAKVENERKKIASVTEVEIRNRLLETKKKLVDAVFVKALGKLEEFVTTNEYHAYLLKLMEEMAVRVTQKNLVVHVNGKDKTWLNKKILNRISKKTSRQLKLSDETEDCIGGCKIQTLDGKITYDNTIDNRLRELRPTLRGEVAKILFGEEV